MVPFAFLPAYLCALIAVAVPSFVRGVKAGKPELAELTSSGSFYVVVGGFWAFWAAWIATS